MEKTRREVKVAKEIKVKAEICPKCGSEMTYCCCPACAEQFWVCKCGYIDKMGVQSGTNTPLNAYAKIVYRSIRKGRENGS